MILTSIKKQSLIHPPEWLIDNTHYLTLMGSQSYGVSNDFSDFDMYGFCIPPKDNIFPHLKGEIPGFGNQIQRFEQYQEHHIKYLEKEYDFSIYSIVKYFQLVMENNPNMVDSLFTPENCIHHITQIGRKVRDNRKIFLSKKAWHTFKGYSYSQLHKMTTKNPEGKRKETIKKYGYDVKFAYHLVRLLNEVEQILVEGDLDLHRNREQLKSIRRGEWSEDRIINYFNDKEKQLEEIYLKSELPWKPDEQKIKELLLECLEMHFGNLNNVIYQPNKYESAINEIKNICNKF